MPRKTDSNSPADWLGIVEDDLVLLRVGARDELSYALCRSKLAEVLEKVMKAELIRLGWTLERTHDLQVLHDRLADRGSDLLGELRDPISALADAYFSERYVGFDLEDPDWPALRAQLEAITSLTATIRSRLPQPPP